MWVCHFQSRNWIARLIIVLEIGQKLAISYNMTHIAVSRHCFKVVLTILFLCSSNSSPVGRSSTRVHMCSSESFLESVSSSKSGIFSIFAFRFQNGLFSKRGKSQNKVKNRLGKQFLKLVQTGPERARLKFSPWFTWWRHRDRPDDVMRILKSDHSQQGTT